MRDVACREHVVGRVQGGVDDHAVFDLQSRAFEPAGRREDAYADDDYVSFDGATVVERHDWTRVAFGYSRHAGAGTNAHAVHLVKAREAAPIWSPSTLPSGTARASRTVTVAPSELAVAATSEPMNPPPTTTSRVSGWIKDASRRESSSVRSVTTLSLGCTPGRLRGCDPVAITALSKSRVEASSSSIE